MAENTSTRLKKIMGLRGLRQRDVLALAQPYCDRYKIKLNKSDLSQFVNGKVEPGQWKLTILGLALNVSEAWLMGLDVPMEREASAESEKPTAYDRSGLSDSAKELLDIIQNCTEEQAALLLRLVKSFLAIDG